LEFLRRSFSLSLRLASLSRLGGGLSLFRSILFPPQPTVFRLAVLSLIGPEPFCMGLIVPLLVRNTFRPMLLIMALFQGGYSVGMPGRYLAWEASRRACLARRSASSSSTSLSSSSSSSSLGGRPIPLFRGGYSVGMPGPVPGFGGPSPRPSLGFFSPELCQFVVNVGVVVVAWWVGRGGAFRAVAGAMAGLFFGRHRGMAVVLVGASKVD